VKLLIQPGAGIEPLLAAISGAKKTVEIVIFRFDQKKIEQALGEAVKRGVSVQALIAHTNRAGEENLRNLEMRLLSAGVTVSRTADDLVRYHAKYMIIDRRELFVLAFNLTFLDIERSRSFGIVTRNRSLVTEAVRLFEADTQRHPYESDRKELIVSPANSRQQLSALIKSAKKELLIYDLKISDQAMIRVMEARAKAGVNVRILGRITRKIPGVMVHKLAQMRLHARVIIVDGKKAFVGSQSLRELEMDSRREVGVIVGEVTIVSAIHKVFEEDWALTQQEMDATSQEDKPVSKVARKVAKAVSREMPLVIPALTGAVEEAVGGKKDLDINPEEVEDILKVAVKEAVAGALRNVVEKAIQENGSPAVEKDR